MPSGLTFEVSQNLFLRHLPSIHHLSPVQWNRPSRHKPARCWDQPQWTCLAFLWQTAHHPWRTCGESRGLAAGIRRNSGCQWAFAWHVPGWLFPACPQAPPWPFVRSRPELRKRRPLYGHNAHSILNCPWRGRSVPRKSGCDCPRNGCFRWQWSQYRTLQLCLNCQSPCPWMQMRCYGRWSRWSLTVKIPWWCPPRSRPPESRCPQRCWDCWRAAQ